MSVDPAWPRFPRGAAQAVYFNATSSLSQQWEDACLPRGLSGKQNPSRSTEATSETHVRIKIVKTLAINLLTSIDSS
ncbi:hypothetical protein E2C01_043764 [Portunus trituberculatus]|uniref:Uncharacterized protein n=1 Tax=Portunus trituberculatus TaxID=210409 RepID=A0A5B7FXL1_PORTR|nr:hypothetical protein [Portunus trituberculatus]